MAQIAKTKTSGGVVNLEETILSASDTFEYVPGSRMMLCLRNPTAGTLSPNIDGDAGTTVPVRGVGDVSVASGYDVGPIAAGDAVLIPLDTISAYLQGTIVVTGGDGLVATLIGD